MIVGRSEFRAWLPCTILVLLGLCLLIVLGAGPESTLAQSPVAEPQAARQGLTMTKAVNAASILPGHMPYPVYTIRFNNTTYGDLVVTVITDTLPAGFEFAGFMDASSDWNILPDDPIAPVIVWDDSFTVPARSERKLAYRVRVPASVPEDVVPRVNEVWARTHDDVLLGPARASIVVGQAELRLAKAASDSRVVNGQPVTYTVTLANDGEITATIDLVTDTLDPALVFDTMLAGSDVLSDPVEVTTGTLVWSGPVVLPPRSTRTMRYRVNTPPQEGWLHLCNEVEIAAAEQVPAPAGACIYMQPDRMYAYVPLVVKSFEWARLTVAKSVTPGAVPVGVDAEAVFNVAIVNAGDTPAVLRSVVDTLPFGLVYLGMAPGSDVVSGPDANTGTITWTGNWVVAPGQQLDVAYRVRVGSPVGTHVNSVRVTADGAIVPAQPATASLVVDQPIAGLRATNDGPTVLGQPTTLAASVTAGTNVVYTWSLGDNTSAAGSSVSHVYPAEGEYTATVTARNSVGQQTATTVVNIQSAVLLEEHFDDQAVGISRWTKFLNYWRLEENQWRWEAKDGFNGTGAATQDCWLGAKKVAEDALLMYLGEGSAGWTDYRVQAKIMLRGGVTELDDGTIVPILEGGYPIGLWVRGQYQDIGDKGGGWVTGYYVNVGGNSSQETMFVRLSQLQTSTDCWDPACSNPGNLYDFNNPHTLEEIKLQDRTFERYVWYDLAVDVRGSNIKIYFEDELIIDYTDPKEPFLTGTIGLKTYKSKTASFDDIVVTPLE